MLQGLFDEEGGDGECKFQYHIEFKDNRIFI